MAVKIPSVKVLNPLVETPASPPYVDLYTKDYIDESQAAQDADRAALWEKAHAETAARIEADQNLLDGLVTEINRAGTAEANLQTNINLNQNHQDAIAATLTAEIQLRTDGDAALIAKDTDLQSQIDAIDTSSYVLKTDYNTKVGQLTSADKAMADFFNLEVQHRDTEDKALNARIDAIDLTNYASKVELEAEKNARIGADQAITDTVHEEVSDRAVADQALNARIDTEIAARAAEDTQLQTLIEAVADSVEALDIRVSTLETTVATQVTDLASLTTRVTQTEADIAQEITDRGAADTALGTRIDAVVADMTTANTNITANTNAIAGVKTRMTAAETAITDNDTAINARVDAINTTLSGLSGISIVPLP